MNNLTYKHILVILLKLAIFTSCSQTQKIVGQNESKTEIEIGITEIMALIDFLGQPDDGNKVYSCGSSSGSTKSSLVYKKYGIVLETKSYTPSMKNYKNGIVRNIQLFDTTNLSVRNSPQQRRYDNQEFFPVSEIIVKQLFGNPKEIKNYRTTYAFHYPSRQMTFIFEKTTNKFIKLSIEK